VQYENFLLDKSTLGLLHLLSFALADHRASYELVQPSFSSDWAHELIGKRVRLRRIEVLSDVVSDEDEAYLRLASLRSSQITRSSKL